MVATSSVGLSATADDVGDGTVDEGACDGAGDRDGPRVEAGEGDGVGEGDADADGTADADEDATADGSAPGPPDVGAADLVTETHPAVTEAQRSRAR
jgi:hypothetical protein